MCNSVYASVFINVILNVSLYERDCVFNSIFFFVFFFLVGGEKNQTCKKLEHYLLRTIAQLVFQPNVALFTIRNIKNDYIPSISLITTSDLKQSICQFLSFE